jgi:23S rRNA (cytosine1962-C5)-methyltransferase
MGKPVREVKLRSRAALGAVLRGHPWVWRDAVEKGIEEAVAGEQVQVISHEGSAVGRGLVDGDSPIGIRMWTHGTAPIDGDLFRRRLGAAVALRRTLLGDDTDAYRLLHGEGDRMPGFVVDRYAAVAVLRTDGEGAAARQADLVEALRPVLSSIGVATLVHRQRRRDGSRELQVLSGPAPADSLVVREHGVTFVVDVTHGQKTGAFLDHRENRRRVGQLSRGRRVLNLFSYTGGFSVHALLGGARHVTNVDVAAAAHATAQESFRLAGLDPRAHAFVVADAQGFLVSAAARGERWDLIVSDPPSFAPSERARSGALSAYRALHRACVRVLGEGGILCAASCSSHVDATAFLSTLDDAALGGRPLVVAELHGAGADHPTTACFPEGRYLKFALLA